MAFYEQFVQFSKVSGEQSYARCPMHPDMNESFTVNMKTDEWYCHGCGCGGKYVEFLQRYYDVGRDVAAAAYKQWEQRKTFPFPTQEYVDTCARVLQDKPAEIKVLHDFGITDEVIERFKLGYDDTRITIPVYSRTGRLINVRKYLPPHRRGTGGGVAKVIGVRGCNEARYYPYENLTADKDTIYIVEGEKDCLVAISQGFNAVTGTGGSNMPQHEEELFRNKTVYLMGDNDPAGATLTARYIKELGSVAKAIKIVHLPCKDFTEFWMEYHSNDVSQYTEDAIRDVPSFGRTKEEAAVVAEETTASLTKSEFVENLNQWVTLKNMSVIGVDPKTYTVPSRLKVKCCNGSCTHPCRIGATRVAEEVEVDPRQILWFVGSNDDLQDRYLRRLFSCKYVSSEPAAYTNVQIIMFQESASFADGMDDASYEPRYGIYMYEETRLIPTVKYNFQACRVTDPRNQQNYYVIRQADAVQSVAEACNESTVKYFQQVAEQCKTLPELINFHYKKWESTLGIEGRPDLFGAILLTYASVTEIKWKGGIIKGWLDAMVIGDTRTGKSQMAQRFVKYLQMGSYINGENAKRTGVIGGVQHMGDSWIITWGAIPMNDKGLLVIDEASGLEVDDIKELSATRSSGAVTINKIAKGEARARTRLLWLSNPRSGKNIEDFYWKGYGAFMEYIPVVEDQARFDLVLSAAREDVGELTGLQVQEVDESLYRRLFSFAWNVDREDVIISGETAAKVEEVVKRISKELDGGPLVVSVAVHEKLLRLSCAFSVLCGSITGKRLIVQPMHVEYAYEFLVSTLTKPTLDYKSYIDELKRAQKQKAKNVDFVKSLVTQYPAIRILLSAQRFKGSQVQEILGVDRTEASKIISELLTRGLMKINFNGSYQSDKILIDITRQMGVN